MREGVSNRDVAAVFAEMSELLDIRGGDRERARAFSRIARTIENLPEPVGSMIRHGTLDKVRGLGPGTIYRVKEILATGGCADLHKLREALPAGLRSLLQIRGVGARTVRLLHHHLKVSSLAELELAVRQGKLRGLPRTGPGLEEKLRRGLEDLRRRAEAPERIPLFVALERGRAIQQALLGHPAAVQVELAGSVRRGKDTVRDLDLVAASTHPTALVDGFIRLPGVAEVLERGVRHGFVRLAAGQQADIWVFPPEEFGAGLHSFSGSSLHCIGVKTRAHARGLKITEHGVLRREDERPLFEVCTEAHVYEAIGLPWIPPELRESAGEFEAAERGKLPRLIREPDLQGELHAHTTVSDGTATARAMAESAARLGLQYLAITDHSEQAAPRLGEQTAYLRRLEEELGGQPRLLSGIEVDILPDGSLAAPLEALRELDWVVASVHTHFDMTAEEATARLVRAIESGVVDVLGHPTGRRLGRREGYAIDLERVIAAAARVGVALELNASPQRLDLDATSCRHAKTLGVPICLDTDAHAPDELARRELGVLTARRGWLEARDVLNAGPLERIVERRRARLGGRAVEVAVAVVASGKGGSSRRPGGARKAASAEKSTGAAEAGRKPAKASSKGRKSKPAAQDAPAEQVTQTEQGEPAPAAAAVPTAGAAGAPVAPAAGDLDARLRQHPLALDLADRVAAFLGGAEDPDLEAALAALGPNPIQAAFRLLAAEAPPAPPL